MADASPASPPVLAVAILADDLIWATRLADAARGAGAQPKTVRRLADLETALASPAPTDGSGADGTADARLAAVGLAAVIVDLTARAYDGVAAIRVASAAGARVIAVGQHDDAALRRAALDAGAERVFTYRALFEDGPRLLGRWLGR